MVTRKGKQRKKVTKVVLAWKGKKFLNRAKEGGDNNISTFQRKVKIISAFALLSSHHQDQSGVPEL